jgi:hypothetical protein
MLTWGSCRPRIAATSVEAGSTLPGPAPRPEAPMPGLFQHAARRDEHAKAYGREADQARDQGPSARSADDRNSRAARGQSQMARVRRGVGVQERVGPGDSAPGAQAHGDRCSARWLSGCASRARVMAHSHDFPGPRVRRWARHQVAGARHPAPPEVPYRFETFREPLPCLRAFQATTVT